MGGRIGTATGLAAALALCLIAGGCATGGRADHATLWMNHAAERGAVSVQVYRQALAQVDRVQQLPNYTALPAQTGKEKLSDLPPAVILDIDETVLDNAAYQAMLAATGTHFPDGWDAWIARAEAPAVPGAVAFLEALEKRRVTALFVTNRTCAKRPGEILPCPQEGDTLRNLQAAGVPGPTAAAHVLLAGEEPDWTADKESRRAYLAERYRILALVGDDLGDFLPGLAAAGPAGRKKAATAFTEQWGKGWFMLPNPMYGGWLRALDNAPATPPGAKH